MDHGFRSRRDEIAQLRDLVETCADLEVLLGMSAEARAALRDRLDATIEDDAVRRAATRRAARLGLLDKDVAELCRARGVAAPGDLGWRAFLVHGTAIPAAAASELARVAAAASEMLAAARADEEDAGSSSYDDYSDSDTRSTSSTEVDDMEDDEEEDV